MKYLNISTRKMDGKNHITSDDLELLNQLDDHLATGANKALFRPSGKVSEPKSAIVKQAPQSITVADTNTITEPIPTQLPIPDLIEQLARAITSKQSDPLSNYDALEKAYSNSWIISS